MSKNKWKCRAKAAEAALVERTHRITIVVDGETQMSAVVPWSEHILVGVDVNVGEITPMEETPEGTRARVDYDVDVHVKRFDG